MEKIDFIEKAPQYYFLAIVVAVRDAGRGPKTLGQLDAAFDSTNYRFFSKTTLITQATKLINDCEFIRVIPDDFGQTLYEGVDGLDEWISTIGAEMYPLFGKFVSIGENKYWLSSAVRSVNDAYEKLKISADDFSDEWVEAQWEPIPLDRNDERLKNVTNSLEGAIAEIEGENGYAVYASAEREYVITNLKAGHDALKSQPQIYLNQVRVFILEPLGRVIKRFGGAAVGITALAARNALLSWLKEVFEKGLHLISH